MLKKIYYWFREKMSKPDEKGQPSAGYWQDMVRTKVLGLCRDSRGSILEVGCGEGLFLKKLLGNEPKPDFFGIDISIGQLLKARQRLNLENSKSPRLLQAGASSLPFKDRVFDRVVCINVFMNMPKEELVDAALKEIKRVSKKGGRIIFDIRNKSNLLINIKYKLAKYYDATIDRSRLRMFKPQAFENKLENLNFRVTKRASIGFPKGRFAPVIIMEAVSE